MHPNTPKTGEAIVQLTIDKAGRLTMGRQMVVIDRSRVSISESEFMGSDGCRHDTGKLHPGKPAGGAAPMGMVPTSCFYYAREKDLQEAKLELRDHWVSEHTEHLREVEATRAALLGALANARSIK